MKAHFLKKINFYKEQDNTKWVNWPRKKFSLLSTVISESNKSRNFKLRNNRKRRKTARDADRALKSSSVIVMVNEDVPLGAIALLGKGLNYIPTPSVCPRQEQLDMRLAQNQILKVVNQSQSSTVALSCIPSSLFRTYYGAYSAADESNVNTIVNDMINNHNNKLQNPKQQHRKKNITRDEENGLKWLIDKSTAGQIAVVQADKGGALLIVYPSLLRQKVYEKVTDKKLYDQFEEDPTDKYHTKLFDLWVDGKLKGYISPKEASMVMGVTDINNKSTSPHFKPGTSYFYPMLKIHKLRKEEVTAAADPPARLVTALHDGISKRSDVFLAKAFIQHLEKEFCKDLLKDTNEALYGLIR